MDKAEFVKALLAFFNANTTAYPGIESLDYKVEGENEWVYVTYKAGGKKRFCVTADSNYAIIKDFIKFIENRDAYKWILED